jgi:hypothetical protein
LLDYIRYSAANIVFFSRRVPLFVHRRLVGWRYLRSHRGMSTRFVPAPPGEVIAALAALSPPIHVDRFRVDVNGYRKWKAAARYPFLAYHIAHEEKYLEHYLSWELLRGVHCRVLVDVASCRSFFPVVIRRQGIRVIEHDLAYPPGLHGDRLGSDAAAMPLPDASVDAMTLHCSFEHFEGDTDVRFLQEAQRVVRPGGRVVIIPLYLHVRHQTLVDPAEWERTRVPIEDGADIVVIPGYGNRHGRIYDPSTFVYRIYDTAVRIGLRPRIVHIENACDVSPHCYLQFAFVLDKMGNA